MEAISERYDYLFNDLAGESDFTNCKKFKNFFYKVHGTDAKFGARANTVRQRIPSIMVLHKTTLFFGEKVI